MAGGGGGVGIGHSNADDSQHGRNYKNGRSEFSGYRRGTFNATGGAGKKLHNKISGNVFCFLAKYSL